MSIPALNTQPSVNAWRSRDRVSEQSLREAKDPHWAFFNLKLNTNATCLVLLVFEDRLVRNNFFLILWDIFTVSLA